MCTEPLYAIRLKTEYDKKFQRFGKRTPIQVLKAVRDIGKDTDKLIYNRKVYDLMMVSCGQCLQCRLQRVKQRSVMSICESLEHDKNSFITLTFSYEKLYQYYRKEKKLSHYLATKKAHFHEWSLETEFFQKFMKRLRFYYYNRQLAFYLLSLGRSDLVYSLTHPSTFKEHIRIPKEERPFLLKDFKPKKIRCLHCGEYGEKKGRPHHHAILFGFQFEDLKVIYENNCKYYVSDTLEKLWPFGIHRIGDCTFNSCAYVSRYIIKKVNGNNQEQFYNGRKPEYVTYSIKPVLGANYFIKNYKEIVNTQELSVVADKKYTCRMPKSYDEILKKIDIDMYNDMKEKRVEDCKTDLDKLFKQTRSIYSKLDSGKKKAICTLRKLVRGFELGGVDYDEYRKKALAFGVSMAFFDNALRDNACNFLDKKNYKSHISKSSNADIREKYYKFELARNRSINNCYNLKYSDEQVKHNVEFFKNIPNPFKVFKRGRMLKDYESNDYMEYIDEKGRSYCL